MLPFSNILLLPISNITGKQMKNKEVTKQSLLNAVEELITESGFEAVRINAVATRAGVSKMLIYRYFESLDGLLTAYIRQYDFWINYTPEISGKEELSVFIKSMLRQQAELTRKNDILRRLYRWELSSDNKWIQELREEREKKGKWIVDTVAQLTGQPREEIAVTATLITASITYLALLEENCRFYNGIPLQEELGWTQLINGLDAFVDLWLTNHNLNQQR